MKNIIYLFVGLLVLSSCKSRSNTVRASKKSVKKERRKKIATTNRNYKYPSSKKVRVNENIASLSSATLSNQVIANAYSFKGTKYKYGGTTHQGMDCSGLIYTSFKLADISLPRTSLEQSKKGIRIAISKVKTGDLLFFKTGKENKISHVGLVTDVTSKNIEFIHTSSSKGVVISSLSENYWSKAFSVAKRFF